MKKKIMYGIIATALIALNVFAFSFSSVAADAAGGSTKKYQTMGYCTGSKMDFMCTTKKLAYSCSRHCGKKLNAFEFAYDHSNEFFHDIDNVHAIY